MARPRWGEVVFVAGEAPPRLGSIGKAGTRMSGIDCWEVRDVDEVFLGNRDEGC